MLVHVVDGVSRRGAVPQGVGVSQHGANGRDFVQRVEGVAAVFPTKSIWLKAIRKGNFLSWPLINVKNVNKYFPESEETQRGHMRNQRQGVRSTQLAPPPAMTPMTVKLLPLNLKSMTLSSKSTM